MKQPTITILAAVSALGVLTLAFPRQGSAEEEHGYFKWVDVEDNCVSTCDITKYQCPCYRQGPL